MIIVRCKEWGTELKGDSQTKSCGCPNMLTVTGDTFTARNLTNIVVVKSNHKKDQQGLTSQDLEWQEQRRKRKVRKLDFEIM